MSRPSITWKGQPIMPSNLEDMARELVRATDALAAANAYRAEQAGNMDEMLDWALERANLAVWSCRWTLGISEAAHAFEEESPAPPDDEPDASTITTLPEPLQAMLDAAHHRVIHGQSARDNAHPADATIDAAFYRIIGAAIAKMPAAEPSAMPVTRIPDVGEPTP